MPIKKRQDKSGIYLSFSHIFPSHISAFVTNRKVDFQYCGRRVLSSEQKQALRDFYCLDPMTLTNILQVHGRRVVVLRTRKEGQKADGLLTDRFELPLAVRTADCLSVFLYVPQKEVIGLIHAGWRSTKKEILVSAVSVMKKHWGINPQELIVAFGPAIQQCCYEVDDKLRSYFPRETKKRDGRFYLNLPLANKKQLLSLGIKKKNIHDCGACTCCNKQLFSYRREGERAGRMLSIMAFRSHIGKSL